MFTERLIKTMWLLIINQYNVNLYLPFGQTEYKYKIENINNYDNYKRFVLYIECNVKILQHI